MTTSDHGKISVHELSRQEAAGKVDLIDVRTPLEFQEVRAAAARNIPLDKLDPHAVMKNHNADLSVFVICKGGTRGRKAQQKFADAGFTNVTNVEGGTDAWVAAGLPLIRGQKVMSLERQVRIAAGFIVLVGAVAAIAMDNVYLAGIPAFIGAGLVFAGITDSCAMGMLIAKMPWNQVKGDGACCTVK
ncbi:MAG: rhodanese-like domain-containing protein [Rubripirellula sp.]